MIEIDERYIREFDRHSSKGNQLKAKRDNTWYKADYTGYEGLVEYIVSRLLEKTSLNKSEYVLYDLEQIKYKRSIFNGCKSVDFLSEDWQIITLQRLYKNRTGHNLNEVVWKFSDYSDRLKFSVTEVEKLTGITDFGKYMNKILTIDAFFLNEDRHMHNVAVLMNSNGEFKLCPIFDQGASLLADTTLDYPMGEDIIQLMNEVEGKTICRRFDDALDVSEELYGSNINFYFTKSDVTDLLNEAKIYSQEIRERVKTIIFQQMNKYQYLFKNK